MRAELLKVALGAALGALAGYALGNPFAGLAAVLAYFLIQQFRHLTALRRWLARPRRVDLLPEAGGAWGEAFGRLIELQRNHRRRNRRLMDMLAEFQSSAGALGDGALVLDETGRIAWFNAAARALLGLEFPKDVGQRLPNLVRMPAFAEYFSAGQFDRELLMPAPENAAMTLALKIIPYGNHQLLLMVRDVSETERLARIRRDFVANASHELRTPLTVLRGYLEMMEPGARDGGPLAEWQPPLAEMRRQAQRMDALIGDLLKLAQIESGLIQGRQQMLDVASLIEAALGEARALSDGRHTVTAEIDAGLQLYGRELEAMSIFTNLIGNAVRYTPAGGTVHVRWAADGDAAVFAVTDSGIGIDPLHLPRLTERFYRVDAGRSSASGGTGLGLSIVKHALENLDGALAIASKPGAGSTFTARFPAHRVSRRDAALPIAAPAGSVSRSGP